MEKPKVFALSLTKEEISNARIRKHVTEIFGLKMDMQRYHDFITISEAEFEIVSKFGDFVPAEKYHNQLSFKGEVGKIKGKRLVKRE